MKSIFLIPFIALSTTSCATLNDSIQLGAGLGGLTGATSTFAAYSTRGHSPSFGTVALGAGIGMGIGVLTSYFVHQRVDEQRQAAHADQFEMNFGDLPPSPFVFPKPTPKKGIR